MTDFLARFGWPAELAARTPIAIAHRGASDHAPENTLRAFRTAARLGAEMWELDLRVTADGQAVVSHDADLRRIAGHATVISESTLAELQAVPLPDGERLATLDEVVALARETGTGLYIELKDAAAGPAAWEVLRRAEFRFAALGAFVPDWIAALREAGCDWPLSVLVPRDTDPIAFAAPARPDIVHICWLEAADRPDRLVTDALVADIRATGAEIVTWHEHRAEVIAALKAKPLLGICSNRPEVLKPARPVAPQIVCHRGANAYAPENTLAAARICFDQRLDFVEIDVRTTADGHLVVMHDADVDRTTDGTGLVADLTLAEIRALDAGAWFSDIHAGTRVPTLAEVLELGAAHGLGVYVEVKSASPSAILSAVDAAGMRPACFFWTSDTDALHWMRKQGADIQLMAPRWMYGSVEEAASDYEAQIIEFDVTRDDLGEVPLCRPLGRKSMIYSQSHDPDDLSHYLGLCPDMVNLDAPDQFKLMRDYALGETRLSAGPPHDRDFQRF